MIAFVVLLAVLCVLLLLPTPEPEPVARISAPSVEPQPVPPFVTASLSERLEQVAAVYPGTYGTVVFDPASGRTVARNADEPFFAASIAKLPVMLALYRAAAEGELSLEEEISMLPSDVQAYGTGVLYNYPVGHTMTLRECSEFMIQDSDNTAWVMLERRLGKDRIAAELEAVGATSTDYEALQTTPRDVLRVLKAVADPSYTSPRLSEEMLDTMTDTSFEDRLPAPLPEGTRVAHKIGSYGSTYSDAGLVFEAGARDTKDAYFIVVMSTGTTEGIARQAIRSISRNAYEALTG